MRRDVHAAESARSHHCGAVLDSKTVSEELPLVPMGALGAAFRLQLRQSPRRRIVCSEWPRVRRLRRPGAVRSPASPSWAPVIAQAARDLSRVAARLPAAPGAALPMTTASPASPRSPGERRGGAAAQQRCRCRDSLADRAAMLHRQVDRAALDDLLQAPSRPALELYVRAQVLHGYLTHTLTLATLPQP